MQAPILASKGTKALIAVLVAAVAVAGFGLAGTFTAPKAVEPTAAPEGIELWDEPAGGGTTDAPALPPNTNCGPSPDLTGREKSWNGQFGRWLNVEHVIHPLLNFEGLETHYVGRHQPILVGFEWGQGDSPESLDENITLNPDHDLRVVIDGTVMAGNWKQYYQPAFVAATQCGPNWSWDHDSDGPGDGNGNGIGDWSGAVLFWRAPLRGLSPGSHVLTVEYTFDGGLSWLSIPGGTIMVR